MKTPMRPNKKFSGTDAKRPKPFKRTGMKKKIIRKVEKTDLPVDFKDVNLLQRFMINGYISFTKKKKYTKQTMSNIKSAIKKARYLGLVSC